MLYWFAHLAAPIVIGMAVAIVIVMRSANELRHRILVSALLGAGIVFMIGAAITLRAAPHLYEHAAASPD